MARYFARSILVVAFLIGLVAFGGPQPANAVAGCNSGPTKNTADVALSQSATGSALVVTYKIVVDNLGPCQLPTLSLHDDLPSQASSWAIVGTNPGSWIGGCPVTSGNASSFDCTFNTGLGVPGDASLTLQVTFATAPSNTTNHAIVGGPFGGVTEVNPDNNESWGGLLAGGATIADGVGGTGTDFFVTLAGPSGAVVSASVGHKNNANGFKFNKADAIKVTNADGTAYFGTGPNGLLTFTFFFNQALYGKPSQITIVHVITSGVAPGTYILGNCKGNTVPPQGCITSRATTTIGGVTYSVITVTTPQNEDWGAGGG